MACVGFFFLLLHANTASLHDKCPKHRVKLLLRDVLPTNRSSANVFCRVKLTETSRYTKCQESCSLGKKPCTQIVSMKKICICIRIGSMCYTHTEITRLLRDQNSENQN